MANMIAGMNQIIRQSVLVDRAKSDRYQAQTSEASHSVFSRKDIFPDLHLLDGPLQSYRKQSTVDWRKLRLIFEDEDSWNLRYKIWNFMEKDPMFQERSLETLPLDEQRHQATKKVFKILNERFYDIQEYIARPDLSVKFASSMMAYDPSVSGKHTLAFEMFPSSLRAMGSDRISNIIEANLKGENVGCFALTEISHGSNALGIRTTATYDISSKTFILNTPDFESAKCWVGNLGKTATHAIVYAQLYTPDGKCQGLNAFVVPIRDTKTLSAFPGVIVGDLGEKIGLNGLDNGFVMFSNYKIPKDYLLSKNGDVDDAGNFVALIKDHKKRMGKSLGALSGGRVNFCEFASMYGVKAITIATRYSASRKQFGPEDSDVEYSVIEYQAQQYRLLPHLASIYAVQIFSTYIAKVYGTMTSKVLMKEDLAMNGAEMHALSSAAKPLCTWTVRDVIQECREACGGHGYLKCATLGDLRNNHDANCTLEGENNILIQQASNFLINTRAKGWAAFGDLSPTGTMNFFKDGEAILKSKWTSQSVMSSESLLKTLDWVCSYLLDKSFTRVQQLKSLGQSSFDVRNNSQVFYAINLSIAYGQRSLFNVFYKHVQSVAASPERDVLMQLVSLYGSNIIIKNYLGLMYEGGFVQSGTNAGELLQNGVLELLPKLKTEAISLVDAIAPPDFILNSPLGMSDGRIYDHLKAVIYRTPETFERVSWWQDVIHRDYIKSKL